MGPMVIGDCIACVSQGRLGEPLIVRGRVSKPLDQVFKAAAIPSWSAVKDRLDLVFWSVVDNIRGRLCEVWSMGSSFLVGL